jgi:pyruvate formate lyase activating enzyme
MTEPERLQGVPGRYWHRLEDGRIQCDVCPRYCRLNEGQRGLCFVRGRQDDRIVLTTYGRSSGFCIDPIEKKPLNHYLPGSPVLSFGTAGCNLTCKFCQNWDISKARELDRLQDAASPEDIVEAATATGSRSIAYTYNDPVVFLEYAVDVAKLARWRGIKNVAVTAGYISAAARDELYTFMDAANVDLKAFTEEFYKRLCTGHLGAVLETLEYLKYRTKVWFEITTLLITMTARRR